MTLTTMVYNGFSLAEIEAAIRRRIVLAAIKMERGNKGRAAKRLGIHRNTITRILGEK
jgi:DNA-binding NtrC family response regulator